MLSVVPVKPARAGGAVLEAIQSRLSSIRNGTVVIQQSEIEPRCEFHACTDPLTTHLRHQGQFTSTSLPSFHR